MRTLKRAVATSCAAVLVVPLWGVPAQAAPTTGSEAAAYGAYFSSTGVAKPDASPQAPPNVISDSGGDGVGKGHLAVAARANMDDKVSFLYFTLTDVPLDATITKATVTVPLVPNSPMDTRFNEAPAKVQACPSGPEGFFGEDGASLALAPSYRELCKTASAVAAASPDGSAYVFDVTAIAQGWLTANDGLALNPVENMRSTPFQVVFDVPEKASIALEYTAPEVDLSTGTDTSTPTTGSTDTGTTTDLGTTDLSGGFDSSTGSGASDLGSSFGSSSAAPLDGPVLAAGDAPQTADTPAPALATERTAASLPAELLRPTPAFWLAALVLGGALLFLGLVLGDPRPATAATTRPSRLTQALATRQRTGGTASAL